MRIRDDVWDVIIIGSGAAGLMFAYHIGRNHSALILTKQVASESNTKYAQGGIAAVMSIDDSYEKHFNDTMVAGAGLCDAEAVNILVREAPARIFDLMHLGVDFDTSPNNLLEFTREGGHSGRRVLHVGDMTGKAIENALLKQVFENRKKVEIRDHQMVASLLVRDERCYGVEVLNPDGSRQRIYSKTVFLAAGGGGQLFSVTTNPEIATGDGYILAHEAGAQLENLEFIQFHPTAFHLSGYPMFLISEATRGEGGKLLNIRNEGFMLKYDQRAELAPRDVVSRAIVAEMQKTGAEHVFLDLTHLGRQYVESRFPHIVTTLKEYGVDPSIEKIPVAPAAHYFCGGVTSDIDGKTSIEGVYVGGETACTGVRGANRLASNSLLESVVFAYRAAVHADRVIKYLPEAWYRRIDRLKDSPEPGITRTSPIPSDTLEEIRGQLRQAMWKYCGIVRTYQKMKKGLEMIRQLNKRFLKLGGDEILTVKEQELHNLLVLADLVLNAALDRKVNAGTHYNLDDDATSGIYKKTYEGKEK